MKTTRETLEQLEEANRLSFDMFVDAATPEDISNLLDDRDELARLREGLWDEASEWRKAGAHFSGDPLGDLAHRIAKRLETLLNSGDGDGGK